MMNRIALAFIIAMLYMFALELPRHIILETGGEMYSLKFAGVFFVLWVTVALLIHADKFLRWVFNPDLAKSA